MNRWVIWYGLSTVEDRSNNWKMKGGQLELFAQFFLESRTGAYIEWLGNKLIMTANKKHI